MTETNCATHAFTYWDKSKSTTTRTTTMAIASNTIHNQSTNAKSLVSNRLCKENRRSSVAPCAL